MTLTTNQQFIQDQYQDIFGRDASFGTLGGADYWVDKLNNNAHTQAEIINALQQSSEGQSVTTDPTTGTKSSWLGGVNPNLSIAQNIANDANAANPWDKSWASHFTDGGVFASTDASGNPSDLTGTIWEGMAGAGDGTTGTTQNVAGLLNATYNANNPTSTLPNPYYNNAPIIDDGTGTTNIPISTDPNPVIPNPNPGGDATTPGGPDNPSGSWWDQYADIDAFKDALGLGDSSSSTSTGGMDDFMKFMMLMSVMGGGRGGGMGGGSQYGYGGLNPGGVQAAYNPLENLQGMGDWFKNNFGSGGGATTALTNAT